MKVLNLVNQEKSDIKYKISKFPDGQQNIVISPKVGISDGVDDWTEKLKKHKVKIVSRLNNFCDLELIICAVASLRELDVEEIHLYVPYIIGARSDRKFEEGGNNYLRDVICPIINSLNFKTVTCIDPHSDVLEACIKGFRKESNYQLVAHFAIGEIIRSMNLPARLEDEYHRSPNGLHWDKRGFDNLLLVSPDAGASKKIYKLAEQIGYEGDIITCSKDRDVDGKLTKTVVPTYDIPNDKDVIIIDDICDGGTTFINIAKELKDSTKRTGKIYLIVTHGIFSKGFGALSEYFDGIYCTNSYSNLDNFNPSPKGKFVKQLNVF